MGWSYSHRDKGVPIVEALQEDLGSYGTIVESSVTLKVAYLAITHHQTGETYGAVVLIDHVTKPRRYGDDYFNFGTKWIDESMGPAEDRPPRKILEALTDPPPGEYAEQWRQRAWANLRERESRPKVSRGTAIVFETPLRFTNGQELDHFIFVKRSTFIAGPGGGSYMIPRWRDRPHKVYTLWGETPKGRLKSIRQSIEEESVSMGELVELQGLVEHIEPWDTLLLEWAGVPEHESV